MIDKPLYGNPLAGGLESSFNLLQRPDENIERQYFYNKDINKLFNMPGGVRMAAPKGFESVNKNQYEDFASKGATLQGADRFNDAMGGGYNLDLPRLTSGPNSGQVDRNSPEFLYYYGDSQQPKLPPKLSLGPTMPTQEDGVLGSDSNIPLNNFPFGNPNYLDGTTSVNPIVTGPQEIASAETNPYNRVGQQLMGSNQNNNVLETLKNIEKGIASLSLNYGQGNNMNQSSNYGNFDNFGIGNFYPPYGGMYG